MPLQAINRFRIEEAAETLQKSIPALKGDGSAGKMTCTNGKVYKDGRR
jgi:hypothetical protein